MDVEIFNGERIALIRGFRNVREAARNWKTYSSDAPGRVPIPAEDDVRSFRQFPVEIDPPEHARYRDLVLPWFRRAHDDADYISQIKALVDTAVEDFLARPEVDVIADFSLPLQSRALSVLLGLPIGEAEEWISWGVHAFRVDGKNVPEKAAILDDYLTRCIEEARRSPGPDLFSFLLNCTLDGRHLTEPEIRGITHLTFAGGRDTVIHAVTAAIAHLAENPNDLSRLRHEPGLALPATEELIRATSPLPIIGRVCTSEIDHPAGTVGKGERVGLCWADANFDTDIFEAPHEIRFDRKPNPHVGFGSGAHNCLGAPHARLILRSLLVALGQKVDAIHLKHSKPLVLTGSAAKQMHAYAELRVTATPRSDNTHTWCSNGTASRKDIV